MSFTPKDAEALRRNGWEISSSRSRAHRAYRGKVSATISATGEWAVNTPTAHLAGREPDAINAAMEANNRAWATRAYLEAAP